MNQAYQSYAVSAKGQPNKQRILLYFGENKALARNLIRDAIASGYDYGYIKQGFTTVAWFNESSFLRRQAAPRRQARSRRRT